MIALCGFVPVNNVRPFTTGRWIDHKNSAYHNKKVEQNEHMEKINAAKSSKVGPVSSKKLI